MGVFCALVWISRTTTIIYTVTEHYMTNNIATQLEKREH